MPKFRATFILPPRLGCISLIFSRSEKGNLSAQRMPNSPFKQTSNRFFLAEGRCGIALGRFHLKRQYRNRFINRKNRFSVQKNRFQPQRIWTRVTRLSTVELKRRSSSSCCMWVSAGGGGKKLRQNEKNPSALDGNFHFRREEFGDA